MKLPSVDVTASLAAAVVLTGMQGIAPALPQMQSELGLTQFELSLIVVGYVLPGALFAFPAGVIADRFGLSRTIAAALVVFGICGLILFFWHDFAQLLAVRALQGAMFGAILALTIASVSRSVSVKRSTAAQSKRVVIVALGESVAPLASGVAIEASSWSSVFLLQTLAIPMAVLCIARLPPEPSADLRRTPLSPGEVARVSWAAVASLSGAAVQLSGFLRFFLKYALLTFVPVVAVSNYGMSALEVGAMLAVASFGGVCAAALVPRLSVRLAIGPLLALALASTAFPILIMPAVSSVPSLVSLVVLYGVGDGLLAVVNNVVIARVAPPRGRSAYIGITGGIRNAGKLAAPVAVGALAGAFPLTVVLAMLGVVGLATIGVVPRVSKAFNSRGEPTPPDGP